MTLFLPFVAEPFPLPLSYVHSAPKTLSQIIKKRRITVRAFKVYNWQPTLRPCTKTKPKDVCGNKIFRQVCRFMRMRHHGRIQRRLCSLCRAMMDHPDTECKTLAAQPPPLKKNTSSYFFCKLGSQIYCSSLLSSRREGNVKNLHLFGNCRDTYGMYCTGKFPKIYQANMAKNKKKHHC